MRTMVQIIGRTCTPMAARDQLWFSDVICGKVEDAAQVSELLDGKWPEEWFRTASCQGCEYPSFFRSGQPPLFAACGANPSESNAKIVRWLLTHYGHTADQTSPPAGLIELWDAHSYSVLHAAALSGNVPAAELVLASLDQTDARIRLVNLATVVAHPNNQNQSQANQTQTQSGGVTPLFLACAAGEVGMVQFLLSKGAEARGPLACDVNGTTVCMATVMYQPSVTDDVSNTDNGWGDRLQILSCLRECKADLAACDKLGQTLAHKLAARPSNSNDEPAWRHIPWSAELLRQPDHDGDTPLHEAARHHQLSAARFLIKSGAEPDLFVANKRRQLPHHLLFERDISPTELTAVSRARIHLLQHEGCDIGCILHDINKRVFPGGQTALHRAVATNAAFEVVELLLSGAADWHVPDESNQTPLQMAMQLNPALVEHIHRQQEQSLVQLRSELRAVQRLRICANNNAPELHDQAPMMKPAGPEPAIDVAQNPQIATVPQPGMLPAVVPASGATVGALLLEVGEPSVGSGGTVVRSNELPICLAARAPDTINRRVPSLGQPLPDSDTLFHSFAY